jgi:hypothetical protein
VRYRPTGAQSDARAWLPGALVATPQPVDDRGIDIGSYFDTLPQRWRQWAGLIGSRSVVERLLF